MKDIHDNYESIVSYAEQKSKQVWWKALLKGVIASIYVGIGYIGYIYILTAFWGGRGEPSIGGPALVTAAAVFPVGLMLIIFLGGSLFTSENLSIFAKMHGKAKLRSILWRWGIVLVGNLLGGFLIAIIVRFGGIFNIKHLKMLSYIVGHKMDLTWYMVFFSGILCNIVIAGSVWASLATNGAIGKIWILWFAIWLFAIIGFQHVVANGILFSFAWLNTDKAIFKTISGAAGDYSLAVWTGKAFINLLMSTLGNLVGGGVILPVFYLFITKKHVLKNKNILQNTDIDKTNKG